MFAARGLFPIVHAEHGPPATVHVGDDRPGQRGPAMSDDEDVVGLVAQRLRFDRESADARPAVVGQVTVQFLVPVVGAERECNFDVTHGLPPRSGAAPVDRTSITVRASTALARRGALASSTTSVTVTSSDAPDSAPPSRPSTATTSASPKT